MTGLATELQVPDGRALSSVQTLFARRDPYAPHQETSTLFARAMREACQWHREHCSFYCRWLSLHDFHPESIETEADCLAIPPVHANFFKHHEVRSVPESSISTVLTSSGTSGQRSQMFFDQWTLGSAQRVVDYVFDRFGWREPTTPTNYLLFTYEPQEFSRLGTAYTDVFLTKYAPARRVFFALRPTTPGRHDFDLFGTIRTVEEYAEEGLPVRIFGFPAFLHFTLERLRERNQTLELSPESLLLLGGGWKGYADQQVTKEALYAAVTERLGVPNERCRDGFGSVEHCIPYTECEHHHFHVPLYARAIIRDVGTLAPLGYGKPGFLSFLSPYATSAPIHSVLMGDLAELHPPEACPCQIDTPYFEVLGRAGVSPNRSCAMAAAELLARRWS
jgi:phenylacetate-coenzyme A ligase PaaK-like adenylate-forming protein